MHAVGPQKIFPSCSSCEGSLRGQLHHGDDMAKVGVAIIAP